jgi:urea transporter
VIPPFLHSLRRLARITLVSYAQVLLSGSPGAGLLFLAASFATNPLVGLAGLIATLAANLVGYWTYRERIRWELGLAGYNAVMLGLAIGHFLPGAWWTISIALVAGGLSAVVTEYLHRRFTRFRLPVLGLPFLIVCWLVLGIGSRFLVPGSWSIHRSSFIVHRFLALPLPGFLATFLRDLGSVYFSPGLLSGALVLAGLIVASRLSAALGLAGALVGALLSLQQPISISLSINLVIVPIGLAFFLVPNRWLPLYLLSGLALTAGMGQAMEPAFRALGVPLLILPLTVTLFAFLLLGQRKLLDIELVPLMLLHSPETNLRLYRRRLSEPLHLPFFGTWFVSQGVDGGETHKGRLAHAWDFMVQDERGRTFATPGYRLSDYHAFGLLVSAPGAGRVAAIENNVRDNPPGKVNKEQNWGNWVIVEHSPLEYSILAHLQQGSVRVKPGDRVSAGTVIGSCGNSGYSGQPHLHCQLQVAPIPGSEALSARFRNYLVLGTEGERFIRDGIPQQGETLMAILTQEDTRSLLLNSFSQNLTFHCSTGILPVHPEFTTKPALERPERFFASLRMTGSEGTPRHQETICVYLRSSAVPTWRVTLELGRSRAILNTEAEGISIARIRGPRSGFLGLLLEGLDFIPFYAQPGLTFTTRGWKHSFGHREWLRKKGDNYPFYSEEKGLVVPLFSGVDALILESTGKGISRRIWFAPGIGIARIDWQDNRRAKRGAATTRTAINTLLSADRSGTADEHRSKGTTDEHR